MHETIYLFDVDGTLTNTAHMWVQIYADCLRDLGITPPEDVREIAQYTHSFRAATGLGLPEAKLPQFGTIAIGYAQQHLHKAPLHDQAFELISTLRSKGAKVGVVSSQGHDDIVRILKKHAVEVDCVVGHDDTKQHKPDPEGILLALKLLGATPSKSHVYYGDKDTDVEAAHRAGIRGVHFFPPDHHSLYDLELMSIIPDERITHWREVLDALNQATPKA